jgi:hypothetical protein
MRSANQFAAVGHLARVVTLDLILRDVRGLLRCASLLRLFSDDDSSRSPRGCDRGCSEDSRGVWLFHRRA